MENSRLVGDYIIRARGGLHYSRSWGITLWNAAWDCIMERGILALVGDYIMERGILVPRARA
jgi:hypothetical protein